MTKAADLAPRQLSLELDWAESVSSPRDTPSTLALDTSFPVDEANALAATESFNKHLFRPNTYLHKWWARRSGTTFRYVLKGLCDDPARRDYYAIGGLEGKIILDPMMGGGTTIHEAMRLGASVVGFDIDPIPVLQARASLSRIPLKEKEAVFRRFYATLAERLGPFFITSCPQCGAAVESQFILYGLRRQCRCGEFLFVDSLRLREEANGSIVQLNPYTGRPVTGLLPVSELIPQVPPLVYEKTVHRCSVCDEPFKDLRIEPFVQRYRPLVVVGSCRMHGPFWKPFEAADEARRGQAQEYAAQHAQLPSSQLGVPHGPKSDDLLSKGIPSFTDVFTGRQKIYLATCKELLDGIYERHRLWLSLLISTSLEFNSMLCGYKGSDKRRPGAIRHVFSHHAYSFPYTALENNPVFSGHTSGTIGLLFQDRIRDATVWAESPIERRQIRGQWVKVSLRGEVDGGQPVATFAELAMTAHGFLVAQQDSSHMPLRDDSVDHVVTDPPYYDSVQYSDLAHFFRVWLQWFMPDAANWQYAIADSAVAETSQDGSKYQNVLTAIWRECHRVLKKPGGRLVFTFHHWRPAAWAHLTTSLKNAGFRLATSYTVHSENPISVHIRQLKALKHDSILVLQPLESASASRGYPLIEQIDTGDSFEFCSDCARLLGYCLESDLDEASIFRLWNQALGVVGVSLAVKPPTASGRVREVHAEDPGDDG